MNTQKNWLKSLQSLKRSWLLYIVTRRASGISYRPLRRRQPELIPSNIYHHCGDTPLRVFIDCACDQKFKSLVRYGHGKDKDLAKAWELIYSEYSDLIGNASSKLLLNLAKDISYHNAKLTAVGLCLKVLQYRPDSKCIDVLHKYGYNYAFDITDPQQYARDIEAVAARTGSIIITIQLKKAEYDRESKAYEGKPITRQAFYDILATLFQHFHARINPDEVTISEYCSYRKRYELEMRAISRQTEKQKSNYKVGNIGS